MDTNDHRSHMRTATRPSSRIHGRWFLPDLQPLGEHAKAKPSVSVDPTSSHRLPRIAIIGGGMAGMLMAIKLQEAGLQDFVIYEKATEVGGVWRDNTYPGLRCDVPAHMFTYSFEPNPTYSSRFASGAEIKQYLQRIFHRYDLQAKTRFSTSIKRAVFEAGRCSVLAVHKVRKLGSCC